MLEIAEAAEQLGITHKAVRRRIERGTLPSVLGRDGRRRIPAAALKDASPPPSSGSGRVSVTIDADVLEPLMERIEKLAAEAARYKALTDGSERRERDLAEQLHEQRSLRMAAEARAAELEAQLRRKRRWFRRKPAPNGELPGAGAPGGAPGD